MGPYNDDRICKLTRLGVARVDAPWVPSQEPSVSINGRCKHSIS